MHENGQAEDYLSEYMQEVYSGVFFKEFVLFFGENLQYYIMEESENEEQLTESGSLQKSDIMNESPDSKYEIFHVVYIFIHGIAGRYNTLNHPIKFEYYRREYRGSQIVHIAVKDKKRQHERRRIGIRGYREVISHSGL